VINLLISFAGFGPFDVIFLPHCLIYFEPKTKQEMSSVSPIALPMTAIWSWLLPKPVLGLGRSFAPDGECRAAKLYEYPSKGEILRTAASRDKRYRIYSCGWRNPPSQRGRKSMSNASIRQRLSPSSAPLSAATTPVPSREAVHTEMPQGSRSLARICLRLPPGAWV
jgi:hypothetical protein